MNWINKYLEKKLLYIHFTMDDNFSLTDEVKDRYKSAYVGVFYRRYIEGLWVAAEGLIYDMWDDKENSFTWEPGKPEPWSASARRYIAVDYGTTNPTCFLDIRDDGRIIWVVKEYYHDSRASLTKKQKTSSEYADDLLEFIDNDHTAMIIVDPAAEAFQLELRNRQLRVRDADNEVLEGIRMTSTLIAKRRILVESKCISFRKEIEGYIWDEKAVLRGEEKPVKERDHCLSGDTEVDTVFGRRKLKELVGKAGLCWCANKNGKKRIGMFFGARMARKNAPVYKIILADGRSIKATGDHLVLTQDGWKSVDSLKRTDFVADIHA